MIRFSCGRRGRSILSLITFVVALLATAVPAHATDYFAQPGTGSWTTAATWSPVGVPGGSDSVTIPAGATVDLASIASAGSIAVDGGTLNINAGGQVGPMSFALNSGTVSVAGLLMPFNMTIGSAGTLNLHDGGVARMMQDGSLTGTGSAAVTVGPGIGVLGRSNDAMTATGVAISGSGTLRIPTGGSVTLSGSTTLAPNAVNVQGDLVNSGLALAPTTGFTVDNGGRIVGHGTLNAVAMDYGTIEPSGGAGDHLDVLSAYTSTSNSLIRIHTPSAAGTQQLRLLGSAQFAGTVEIDTTDNAETTGTWDLVTATGATGTFDSVPTLVALTLPTVGKPTADASGVHLTAQVGQAPDALTNLRITSGQDAGPSNDPFVDLAWDAGTDADNAISGYSVEFSRSPTTVPDTTVDTSVTNWSEPPIADGTWYAHVRAIDELGFAGPTAHTAAFVIDTTTAVPTLIAPATNARVTTPMRIAYDLHEAPASNGATLVFRQGSTVVATWTLAGGATVDQLVDPGNPLASPGVVSSATGSLADGSYTVTLSSTDALLNAAASTTSTGVTLDRVTQAPTLSSPVTGGTHGGSLPVTLGIPETAQPGSIRLVLTPAVGSAITLTLADTVASVSTVAFDVPLSNPRGTTRVVAASAATIPSGTYSVQLQYRDALGNAIATSTAASSVVLDATTAPPAAPTAATVKGAITTARIRTSTPEAARPGSVQLRITGKGGSSTLTLVDQASGSYDVRVRLDQLRQSTGVRSVSGAASLPVGSYAVTVAYVDAAGNPEATSAASLSLGTPAKRLQVLWSSTPQRGGNRFVVATFAKLQPGRVARLTAVSGTRTFRGICGASPGRTPATTCTITLPATRRSWDVTIDVLRGPGVEYTVSKRFPKQA